MHGVPSRFVVPAENSLRPIVAYRQESAAPWLFAPLNKGRGLIAANAWHAFDHHVVTRVVVVVILIATASAGQQAALVVVASPSIRYRPYPHTVHPPPINADRPAVSFLWTRAGMRGQSYPQRG